MTQFSGGFPRNPLSRRATGNGGFLNQTADQDPRMRQTYTQEEVKVARDGLRLLKSRMDAAGMKKRQANGSAHSANRQQADLPSHFGERVPVNRRSHYSGASANKPPMMPPPGHQQTFETMNTTPLSGAHPGFDGNLPSGNSNYRRAFKPNLGGNQSSQHDQSPSRRVQRQRSGLKGSQNSAQYEPERKSPNVPKRQLSTNRKSDHRGAGGPSPGPQGHRMSGYNPNKYQAPMRSEPSELESAFGHGQAPRMQHSPVARHSPAKSQPSQKPGAYYGNRSDPSEPTGYGNAASISIYERAAAAGADAIPDNTNPMSNDDGTRVPCGSCGRSFAPDVLEKHGRICAKVFQQKRKQFNAKDQRSAEGTEDLQRQAEYSKPFGIKAKKKPSSTVQTKPQAAVPKWKLQSMQFR